MRRHLSSLFTSVTLRNAIVITPTRRADGAPARDHRARRLSRRERARTATIEEIKSTALDLMREQGTTDVRFTDIARVMGMTRAGALPLLRRP